VFNAGAGDDTIIINDDNLAKLYSNTPVKISSPKPATNNSSAEVPVSVSFLSVLVSP
jgi:hypothetical protein